MNGISCTTNACECKKRRIAIEKQVIARIGKEAYEELLVMLPDRYYDQGELVKLHLWRKIARLTRAGERNLRKLAKRVAA